MRARLIVFSASMLFGGALLQAPVAAQDTPQTAVPCRDRPCSIVVDWTREGGYASQQPDRRYGNPTNLERLIKARLTELGFANQASASEQELSIILVPEIDNAMCDEVAGTSTDMSCRAIVEIQARATGPDEVRGNLAIPSRIRNRCSSERHMPIDRLGVFVADWIVYALEGKSKGERRPVARC